MATIQNKKLNQGTIESKTVTTITKKPIMSEEIIEKEEVNTSARRPMKRMGGAKPEADVVATDNTKKSKLVIGKRVDMTGHMGRKHLSWVGWMSIVQLVAWMVIILLISNVVFIDSFVLSANIMATITIALIVLNLALASACLVLVLKLENKNLFMRIATYFTLASFLIALLNTAAAFPLFVITYELESTSSLIPDWWWTFYEVYMSIALFINIIATLSVVSSATLAFASKYLELK